MDKKIAAQLEKLQGAEWDSESDEETQPTTLDGKADFVDLAPVATKKRKKNKNASKEKKPEQSRVIYLGRVPHGFYEEQMQGFFSQFGVVSRLRLSRNKRTGKSKHYAFIEFEEPDVAAVVAKTMHNYRLFDHTLVCHLLPSDAIHPTMFVGANKRFGARPGAAIARKEVNSSKTPEQIARRNRKLVKREEEKRQALKALGIDYTFPGYAAEKST